MALTPFKLAVVDAAASDAFAVITREKEFVKLVTDTAQGPL